MVLCCVGWLCGVYDAGFLAEKGRRGGGGVHESDILFGALRRQGRGVETGEYMSVLYHLLEGLKREKREDVAV